MTVTMNRNDKELAVAINGRLDTLTSPELEEKLEPELENTEKLIFDFEGLEYISSAGLRVLLSAIKVMDEQGEMIVKNVRPEIMEVLEITGFVDFLNIE
ncbi:STAS domain-containing protein [Ruminococcus sp.]|uniref:STAS domain-containing protein n=1 Tax=Ruminococcus sp. TaxID=41978 RepID=UPI0025EEFE29|nr:STAS domain-containing protein [Ruminococcus sp.]MCR4638816.1 STAS domain-containing protein [Ruminococcus sp.]